MPPKGKEVAGKGSKGKRKLDDDKSGGGRKRANPGVLQFFEDAAEEYDDSSDSDFSDLFGDDEFDTQPKVENEPGNTHSLPVFPKQEEMAEEEFDKMMEERYSNARFTYAGDDYESKRSVERNSFMMFDKEPTIWKVKCTVNREKHSVFCLMQKYVDLKSLGTKLQIISAFAVDHSKGHIYVEADRLCDVVEACRGLCSVYSTRVWAVPKNDVSHLLSVRPKYNGVSEGTWVRVKNGKYKGDLAQVVAVSDERKRATVKLIPRIDLQALAQKFGSGVPVKRTATPAPRLISPSELEEFRPLIQYRRDRETGIMFENLDTLMLKDGYLYRKVSIDSLSCSGVMPTEDELLKFKPSENEQSGDMEWLSQLYGDKKKKRAIKFEKGGGKGESSSGLGLGGCFELHDLVCFSRKDFGLVIGTEKDDSYKILKEGSEGPIVVTLHQNDLKNGLFDAKFTALDKNGKSISINDAVRVLEGPLQGRQGTVKQIYRGTIFLYDENETENGGYFCSKSQICEKTKLSADPFSDKAGEAGPSGFDDFSSSPKSPLLPKEDPWQARDNKRDFNQGGKDGFSVGQTLRIRVGPLKGYLCRVLAVRRSDITVKLDSQQKVLTVKSEHLCEVRGKSSNISMSEDGEASSLKPFDLLGTQGGSSSGWMNAAGTSTEGDGWNSGGASAERTSWSNLPANATGSAVQPDSNPSDNPKTDVENTAWGSKVTPSEDVPWGTSAAKEAVANTDSWNKASSDGGNGSSDPGWGKLSDPMKDAEDNWGKAKLKSASSTGPSDDAWGKNDQTGNQSSSWGPATAGKNQEEPWGKGKEPEAGFSGNSNKDSGWGTKNSSGDTDGEGSWGKLAESHGKGQDDSWGKAADKWGSKDGPSESKSDWNSSMARPEDQSGDWSKPITGNKDEASGWKKAEVVSGNQNSGWGTISTLVSGPSEAVGEDQDSGWGNKKSTWSSGPSEAAGGDQDSGWGKKKSAVSSGPSEAAGGDQDSCWGKKKSTVNSARSEAGGNDDSGWGKSKSTWNSGPSESGGNDDSGWGKKSTWNSGSGESGGNQDSGWAKKSTWSSGSGGNQDSEWGKKSSWSSGNASENDNQNESYGGSGNWRGRGGSDRGGLRGRGGYGGRSGSDSGGFGGGGRSDRGGFRGRGSRGGDRGGFGGRGGGDRGFGGRGGDRGGFGGRGGGDRGGFGGRGHGRRDDSGDYKPSSWSSEGNNNNGEGWNSNGGGGGGNSWSQGGGGGGNSWSQGGGGGGNSWSQGGGGGGNNNNGGGGSWSKGGGGNNNNGEGWKSSGGGRGGSWSQGGGSQSWNSGSGGTSRQGGGWNSQGDNGTGGGGGGQRSSWKEEGKGPQSQESGWGKSPAIGDQKKSWNEPDGGGKAGEASGSGWNEGSSGGGGGGGDPWGKKASSSWGKEDDAGSKGGW